MNNESLKHFFDALVAARAILKFSEGKKYEDYAADELLSSAIERKFEIIGEALNRVNKTHSDDMQVIGEWKAIIGFRNILAHAYDRVDDAVVWGIVKNQIPDFVRKLESINELTSETKS